MVLQCGDFLILHVMFSLPQEAAQALIYAAMAGSTLENIPGKISEYLERVQALYSG